MSGGVTYKLEILCFYSRLVLTDSFHFSNPTKRKARNRNLLMYNGKTPENNNIQSTMVSVSTEIIINAPLKKVADYSANHDNGPECNVNIISGDWKTPKPLTVGSLVAFVAHFLGRKLT